MTDKPEFTTEEAAHRYEACPGHCPYCGGSLEKHPLTDRDDTVHRRAWCEGCGAEFTEIYELTLVVVDVARQKAEK